MAMQMDIYGLMEDRGHPKPSPCASFLYKEIDLMKRITKYLKKSLAIILIIFAISFILFEQVRMQTIGFVLSPVMDPLMEGILEEDAERQKKIANGEEIEIATGRDTVLEWGKKFHIVKLGLDNDKVLCVDEGKVFPRVLRRIRDYSFYGNSLYVVSYEGYAVIDANELCRIFITAPLNDFIERKEYGVTSKGESLFYSGKTESEYIVYLDSFSDYSKEEQDKLNKMIEKLK